eukprot:SAG11_NODE_12298_length_710_cov_1.186579_1_plen_45_part_10
MVLNEIMVGAGSDEGDEESHADIASGSGDPSHGGDTVSSADKLAT